MAGRRVQRGVVFPSPVVMLSIVAVLMAAVAFVVTRGSDDGEREVAIPTRATDSSSPTSGAGDATDDPTTTDDPSEAVTEEPPKPRKKLDRGEVFVEVYNNTSISGLAGRVGSTATDVGWQVVGTDNWYGTVPSTTVYYPDRLKRAARVLARDLGVERTSPAEGEMKLDRLTLILTGEL